MKSLFLILWVMLGAGVASAADIKYCGSITSLTYDTDIFVVYRMGVKNDKRNPQYITVKDTDALAQGIAVINDEALKPISESDGFLWKSYDAKMNGEPSDFFVCVTGSELREHNGEFFMDVVTKAEFWKEGEKVAVKK